MGHDGKSTVGQGSSSGERTTKNAVGIDMTERDTNLTRGVVLDPSVGDVVQVFRGLSKKANAKELRMMQMILCGNFPPAEWKAALTVVTDELQKRDPLRP